VGHSYGELATWQRDAGLTPHRLIRLRTLPGFAALAAMKPPLGKRGESDDSKPTAPPARMRSTVLGGS
jgi:hypothetical protein